MARPTEWKPRGVVNAAAFREHSPAGRYLPEPALAGFVEHFWTVAWDFTGQPPVTRETLPHPSVHLVIEKGRSALTGISTARFMRTLEGRGRVLGIKFHPGCFRPFWHEPISKLVDRTLPLCDAFGKGGETLEAEVIASGDDDSRAVNLAEAFVLQRLPASSPHAQEARTIVASIRDERSLMRAEQVAEASGLRLRTLQRLFNEYVGVSPKWVIRRYRLHEAMERMETGKIVDFGALALDLGYFDQAHFIKDFKMMVGRTPANYARTEVGEGTES